MQTRAKTRQCAINRVLSLSNSLSSRLAAEIVDWIIDFLHSDTQALKACSLVCKAWLSSSRYHLFRSVGISGKSAGTFFQELQSPRCSLSSIITSLEIGGTFWKPTKFVWTEIAKLPALQSLTLTCVDLRRMSTVTLPALKTVKLKRLAFEYGRGFSADQFAEIVCILPHLESLSFKECYLHAPTSSVGRLPPTLHTLVVHLDRPQTRYILDWVCLHKPLPPIRTLSVKTDKPQCGTIISMLGDTLEHLTLVQPHAFNYSNNVSSPCESVNLSKNRSLRSLTVRFVVPQDQTPTITLLDGITSPQIQSLSFKMPFRFHDSGGRPLLQKFPWESFARVTSKLSSSLTEVQFKFIVPKSAFWNPLVFRPQVDAVKERLGPLAAIVNIQFMTEEPTLWGRSRQIWASNTI